MKPTDRVVDIKGRYSTAYRHFQMSVIAKRQGDYFNSTNNLRIAFIEITTALEMIMRTYLEFFSNASDDIVEKSKRSSFGLLISIFPILENYENFRLEKGILREISVTRNQLVHGEIPAPTLSLTANAIQIARIFIATYLEEEVITLLDVGSIDQYLQLEVVDFSDEGFRKYRPKTLHGLNLEHFRGFDDRVEIPLRSINLLAGLNSSGKSSIINSILILKQTLLSSTVREPGYLTYKGPYLDAGNLEEISFNHDTEYGFIIGFSFNQTVHQRIKENELINRVLITDEDQLRIKIKFHFFENEQSGYNLSINMEAFTEEIPDSPFIAISLTDNFIIRILDYFSAEERYSIDPDSNISLDYFLPNWQENEQRIISKEDKDRFKVYLVYQDLFLEHFQTIQQELLSNIKYLGPLRTFPQREYLIKKTSNDEIGTNGEDTILVLQKDWKNRRVDFVKIPETLEEIINWKNLETLKLPLGDAINKCLRFLEMEEIKLINGPTVQAKIKTASDDNIWVTIADVGFGVSQILPILVQALISDNDGLLILEQPEIHLHPKAQAKLAELIICFAKTGKRFIIETHSDHLINRIRRLIVEDKSGQLSDLVNIAFLLPPTKGHGGKIENLRINELGLIENWPPGFLAETAEDAKAILKAGFLRK